MSLFTEAEARSAARSATYRTQKTADAILRDARDTARTSFDVFLCHSRLDREIILGVKTILEATGKAVYVDWIDDPLLDRTKVTPATAARLRTRMKQSRSLFYAHSNYSSTSRWMPWELGFFDGHNGNVAILPILMDGENYFRGEEYLGLYPYVDITGRTNTSPGTIYIHRDTYDYNNFAQWRDSSEKLRPAA